MGNVQVRIGKFCREFRNEIGVPLRDVAGPELLKNVSAFEHGRSSNITYLLYYSMLADKHAMLPLFLLGIGEVMEVLILENDMNEYWADCVLKDKGDEQ